jgi:collagen type III alpha
MPKQRDITPLVRAISTVIREHVGKAFQVLALRLDAVDRRFAELPTPKDGRDGMDGKDGAPGERGEAGPAGKDGAPGERGYVGAAGERGERGEPGPIGLRGEKGEPGAPGRDGIDGKEGAHGERGEKGEAGPPGPQGERGERGADGLPGKDGRDGAPGPAGERGVRGETGPQGERGEAGVDGKSVTLADVTPVVEGAIAKGMLDLERRGMDLIQRCIDRIEKPKDGVPGKDGRDAFSLEDLDIQLGDDDRTLTLAWIRGEERVERRVVLAHVIYRGVHQQSRPYQRGDSVTFQGSTWIAMRDTSSKPETDDSWRLAVKRGRDGKDGQKGDKGDRGAPGKLESRQ